MGYIVLKIYKEKNILRGHIIDIMYNIKFKKKILNNMLCFAYNFFHKNRCSEITLWAQSDINIRSELRNLKFIVKHKRPFICKNFSLKKKQRKYLNKKNWFFMMGDTLEIY